MGAKIPRKVVAFQTWQKGITIPTGYSVYVHYKDGLWNINPGKHGTEKYGPEGGPVIAERPEYPVPGKNEGCLIGRVLYSENYKSNGKFVMEFPELEDEGENIKATLFSIDREGILIPKTDYPKVLQLRCNDIDSGIYDNEGELLLELEIW